MCLVRHKCLATSGYLTNWTNLSAGNCLNCGSGLFAPNSGMLRSNMRTLCETNSCQFPELNTASFAFLFGNVSSSTASALLNQCRKLRPLPPQWPEVLPPHPDFRCFASSSLGPLLDHLGCLDRRLHGVGRFFPLTAKAPTSPWLRSKTPARQLVARRSLLTAVWTVK